MAVMSAILKPGQGLLYMKVGTHAQERLEDIIARKAKEIEDAGVAFWGYGGNTCHPQTMVQPFAKSYKRQGGVIYLVMEPMTSRHFAEQIRADEFSVDGIDWKEISEDINVLGSRYALVVKNLRKEELELPLAATKVAVGNSRGAPGSKYIRGRVDKACLEITAEPPAGLAESPSVHIGLVAELVEPYAVYVRNRS
ncbi:MAG TPA: hypothetical protein VE422_30425 [Terriglobia bacterium]|nr:hypothetical protein [Terriglobia bacterium]